MSERTETTATDVATVAQDVADVLPNLNVRIDDHPQLKRINDCFFNGLSPRQIADAPWLSPPVHHTTLWRYFKKVIQPSAKRVLTEKLIGAAFQSNACNTVATARNSKDQNGIPSNSELQREVQKAPLVARLSKRYGDLDELYDAACNDQDLRGALDVIRADTALMRFDAELSGLLADNRPSTTVNLAIVSVNERGQLEQQPTNDAQVIDVAGFNPE